jgi:phosphoribosylformimino-5-aminoimidazole carboxamide ribotide isomerase
MIALSRCASFAARKNMPLLIPVLDLLGGVVVQAVAGDRANYRPIRSSLTDSTDPLKVSEALARAVGHRTVYVADLDAIAGRELPMTTRFGDASRLQIWLDAGFKTVPQLSPNITPILSSEAGVDPSTMTNDVIVSVDLRSGELVGWHGTPQEYIRMAYLAGARRFLVLDVAAVGTDTGPVTLELCAELKQKYPDIELISGGGVRHSEDVQRFADSGVSAVLVASALHRGVLP